MERPPEKRYEVRDPQGSVHILIRTWDGYWHGDENVAAWFPVYVSRKFIREHLLNAIEKNPDMGESTVGDGLPKGYSWLRL